MDSQQLLKAATARDLTPAEIDSVVRALRAGPGQLQETYRLILILGRANAVEHASLVYSYASECADPMLARVALQVLCSFWQMTGAHLPLVKRFLARDPCDPEEDVRQMAISVAGEYLRQHEDSELLRALIHIVESEDEDEVRRADAYLSLARAMGREWEDLPPVSRLPALRELVDPVVMRSASERAARAMSGGP